MKKVYTLLALLLVLSLALSLAGCGSSGSSGAPGAPGGAVSVVGKWTANLDMGTAASSMSNETIAKAYQGVYFGFVVEFRSDGTAVRYADESTVRAAANTIYQRLPAVIAEAAGMSEQDLYDYLNQQGMTVDQYMSRIGAGTPSDLADKLLSNMPAKTASYTVEGHTVRFTADDGRTTEWTVELSQMQMKLTDISNSDGTSDSMKSLLPLVFTRVS